MKTILTFLVVTLFTTPYMKSIHLINAKDIDGNEVSLGQYKGKVKLIVNVASNCGNTPQYKELQDLYIKYKDQGLVVLGFPSNDFMGQEPGSNEKIKEFCTKEYGVTFPMFAKVSVKGKDICPVYKFLTSEIENGVADSEVKWNFQKYLVNKQGYVLKSFAPKAKVTDAEIVKAIEDALAAY